MELKQSKPYRQDKLLLAFCLAWKCILVTVAALSPGPGYDTSALIHSNPSLYRHAEFERDGYATRIALKLFRWDALYFVAAAQRGQVFEQEWAFSWAYSGVLRMITQLITRNELPSLNSYIWTAVAVSTLMHLSAVMTLFRLLNEMTGNPNGGRVSFVACVLHILSPAGLFLVSSYTESVFASVNFLGMLYYVRARLAASTNKKQTIREDLLLVTSGFLFGLATVARSNGLLSGLIFLFDVAVCVPTALMNRLSRHELRSVLVTCVAGVFVAVGFVFPQYVAYQEYCTTGHGHGITAPWCQRMIPSIYTWVQSKYWNVGLFRYWTLSNIPLFLLAAPMLCLLLQSSVAHLRYSRHNLSGIDGQNTDNKNSDSTQNRVPPDHLPQLALPQLVLAITATTSFHVQIINRISSGYPIWYLSVARWVSASNTRPSDLFSKRSVQIVVRGMIMYAIIQGALFASFLPPA
ncbi:GPI mannosyltransferase 2 [Massarina eburnea CBS 473.64]|uniref:GPI mannosyltransferase 2 n=1 Tax=Massarina eburnea CBS 473.64 TaxID=1395130 RepID=A0A6A6S8U4_9PLEO|nr:GPI mannosyltransferase 2 [Massarina eburnea CBS 473.64]